MHRATHLRRKVDGKRKSLLSHPLSPLDARTKCLCPGCSSDSPGSWVHEWCMTDLGPHGGVGGRWTLVAKLGRVRAEDGWKENGENGLQLAPPAHCHTSPNPPHIQIHTSPNPPQHPPHPYPYRAIPSLMQPQHCKVASKLPFKSL